MMKTSINGILLVIAGSASYGILATMVKYATALGHHTGVLTFLQFFIGVVFLFLLTYFNEEKSSIVVSRNAKFKMLAFGSTLGLTSCFYYLALQYISVSLGIILLMQAIWIGVLIEIILNKGKFEKIKVIGAVAVLIGTIFGADILGGAGNLHFTGIGLGLLAGLSYAISLYAANHVEVSLPTNVRSFYMVTGGLIAILFFWNISIVTEYESHQIWIWGALLAIFGTILPPLMHTKGIPLIGIGLASILTAFEIPVSILSAHIVLDERIKIGQWIGVAIIILAVILVNAGPVIIKKRK